MQLLVTRGRKTRIKSSTVGATFAAHHERRLSFIRNAAYLGTRPFLGQKLATFCTAETRDARPGPTTLLVYAGLKRDKSVERNRGQGKRKEV